MSKAVDQQVEQFKRELLAERLSQCSEAQRARFHRLSPHGVSEENLVAAIDLCDRTIKKNQEPPPPDTRENEA